MDTTYVRNKQCTKFRNFLFYDTVVVNVDVDVDIDWNAFGSLTRPHRNRDAVTASRTEFILEIVGGGTREVFVVAEETGTELAEHGVRLVGARGDAVLGARDSREEVFDADEFSAVANAEERRLVTDVGELGAGESRGGARDDIAHDVNVFVQVNVSEVDTEDLSSALLRRRADEDSSRESSRAQESRVESVRSVCRREDEDATILGETIHLDQELVKGLIAFFVEAGASPRSDGVEFIDEDDGRSRLSRLGEELSHASGTATDE